MWKRPSKQRAEAAFPLGKLKQGLSQLAAQAKELAKQDAVMFNDSATWGRRKFQLAA
jgi:X-X-X-Leu-X-X-Gly heptad repeat protein